MFRASSESVENYDSFLNKNSLNNLLNSNQQFKQ